MEKLFELRYKKGGMIQKVHFRAKDLESAISLGKKFTETNSLQFIFVDPWEYDLNELLERKEELVKKGS